MATLQKAIKVGSSVAAVLPKPLLKDAGIIAGSPIFVEAVSGGLFIRSVRKIANRKADSANERVADTALALIKRYQNALDRLADVRHDDAWETVVDFRSIDSRGIPAEEVLKALHRLHESNREVSRRS